MKTITSLILVFFLLASLSGCASNENSDISLQQPAENKKTEILLWKEISKNASAVITSTTEYEYDSNGRKITVTVAHETGTTITNYKYDENGYLSEEEIKSQDGGFVYHCIYENDVHGNQLKATTLDKKGATLTETVCIYDDNGKIQQKIVDGEILKQYTYEKDGSYTETNKKSIGYFKYDKDGNALLYKTDDGETTYNYTDNLLSETVTVSNGNVYKNTYEYKNGCISRQTDYENEQITRIYAYEYDENMRLIKDSVQNAIGVVVRTTYYEYKEFCTENE